MQGKIYLDTRETQKRKKGYPLICMLSHKSKQLPFSLKMSFEKEDWNFKKEEPLQDKTKILIIRKKKRLLEELLLKSLEDLSIDFIHIKAALLGTVKEMNDNTNFFDFGFALAEELKTQKNQKGIVKTGNARVYVNALEQFKKFRSKLSFTDFNYNLLNDFKTWQLTD